MAIVCKIETDKIKNGSGLITQKALLREWDSDLSSMVIADNMFSQTSNLQSFKGNLDNLKGCYRMFSESALPSWDIDMPNLVVAGGMFTECVNLASFESDLSSLVDSSDGSGLNYGSIYGGGTGMFSYCSSLRQFRGNLKSLLQGYEMFNHCQLPLESIACIAGTIKDISQLDKSQDDDWSFSFIASDVENSSYSEVAVNYTIPMSDRGGIDIGAASALTNNPDAFASCIGLLQDKGWTVYRNGEEITNRQYRPTNYDVTAASGYIPIASGWNTYINDYHGSNWKSNIDRIVGGVIVGKGYFAYGWIDTQNVVNGYALMADCANLVEWYGDLDSLTNGSHMFYNSENLDKFRGDLSNLVTGTHMFSQCKLSDFKTKLTNLKQGYHMFAGTALTSWDIDMPNLVYGGGMFNNSQIQSFEGDLSSLVSTDESHPMFGAQGYQPDAGKQLKHFRSNLRSLKSGYNMFLNCKLDQASINHIADVINDISQLDKEEASHWTFTRPKIYYDTNFGLNIETIDQTISSWGRGRIDIGIDEGVDPTYAVSIMKAKNWDVYINGTLQ